MRVSPANKFPAHAVRNGGKMVIVNLQKTPYDSKATLLIHERTDKVMQLLMQELGLTIPEYKLEEDQVKNNTAAGSNNNNAAESSTSTSKQSDADGKACVIS